MRVVGRWLLVAASVLLTGAISAAEVPLFLTGGQSNTDGRLDNKAEDQKLPAYVADGVTNALVSFGGGRFAPFAPATRRKGQPRRWAYDVVLYHHLAQNLGTVHVAKTACGGTSVSPYVGCSGTKKGLPEYKYGYHWSADPKFLAATRAAGVVFTNGTTGAVCEGQSLLLKWMENADAAIDAIRKRGDVPVVKAIVWHQGESDRRNRNYAKDLAAVVEYVREHLAKKLDDDRYRTLPFFCGTVPRASSLYSDSLDKAFLALDADKANNVYVADIYDMKMKVGDSKHFNAAAAETLAKRMYNRMVEAGVVKGAKLDVPACVR